MKKPETVESRFSWVFSLLPALRQSQGPNDAKGSVFLQENRDRYAPKIRTVCNKLPVFWLAEMGRPVAGGGSACWATTPPPRRFPSVDWLHSHTWCKLKLLARHSRPHSDDGFQGVGGRRSGLRGVAADGRGEGLACPDLSTPRRRLLRWFKDWAVRQLGDVGPRCRRTAAATGCLRMTLLPGSRASLLRLELPDPDRQGGMAID
jgi:hypothetical protein